MAFSVDRQDAHPCELQVTISQVLVLVIQSFFCVCSLVRRGYEQGKAVLVFLSQSIIWLLTAVLFLLNGIGKGCVFRFVMSTYLYLIIHNEAETSSQFWMLTAILFLFSAIDIVSAFLFVTSTN